MLKNIIELVVAIVAALCLGALGLGFNVVNRAIELIKEDH